MSPDATRVAHLVEMQQLRALISGKTWIDAHDLQLSKPLPQLDCLSIDLSGDTASPDPAVVVPLSLELPALNAFVRRRARRSCTGAVLKARVERLNHDR